MSNAALSDRLATWLFVFKSICYRLIGRTDVARWANYPFPIEWASRSKQMARFIPSGARVLEFGCGDCELRNFLPAECTYIPTDIVARTTEILVVDLNAPSRLNLTELAPDVAVLAGVVEYLHDVPRVTQWLAKNFNQCIVSYVPVKKVKGAKLKMLKHRLGMGWINHYSEAAFLEIFRESGWTLMKSEPLYGDEEEWLFLFKTSSSLSLAVD